MNDNEANEPIIMSEKIMAKIEHYKPFLRIGMIGDVDSGREVLTAAIRKVVAVKGEPKRGRYGLPEERLIGERIKIWDIEYETDKRRYGHYDVCSYSDGIKKLIVGSGNMDGAILVVSAPEGLMPQTHEQVRLARQTEVPAMVVFLNDVEITNDPELLRLVEGEISELLESCGFAADTPIVRGSAALANTSDSTDTNAPEYQPILKLMNVMDEWIPSPIYDTEKPFRMAVEEVRSVEGRGTVAIGRVVGGKLTKGEEVEIVGLHDEIRKSVATGIEMFRRELDAVMAGDIAGIFLRGIEPEEVERGMILAKPGSIRQHRKFMCQVYILKKEEGGRGKAFFSGYTIQFYIRTIAITSMITLPHDVEMVMPGDIVNLQVKLTMPIALEKGLGFAIREDNLTIGGGIITEILE